MQRKFLCLLAGLAYVFIFNPGCTKIDSTVLGDDLLPAVDNVTTFADTFFIDAARELNVDTTRLNRAETHVLGSINNDPVFGKTKADIFLQLKPSFFPFYFGNANDTINPAKNPNTHFDSVFLCLSYTAFYGDTTKPQRFKVYKLDENTTNFLDTVAHKFDFKPDPYPTNFIGEAIVYQPALKNYTFLKTSLKDSVTNQIRIKLNDAFLAELVSGDSSANGLNPDHSFRNDSLFKEKYKGFAVVSDGGTDANGLFYISLTNPATRLEIFYRASNQNKLDTAFSSFPLSVGTSFSASANANSIVRDTSASEFPRSPSPTALYIQSAPGSAISLKIPQLSSLSNRIIHRAEIFLEQVPGSPGDDVLTAPEFLYLDLVDDTGKKYKPVYYDLSPNEFYNPDNTKTGFFPSDVDNNYFGGYLRSMTDALGTRSYYTFNLTRYVQNLVTRGGTNYKLRVFAPYKINYYGLNLVYKNKLSFGRVKINNGSDPKYRIRMRIIWSGI